MVPPQRAVWMPAGIVHGIEMPETFHSDLKPWDIAAGTAVRFEPGQTRDVQLVALAGKRTVYGFRGEVMGKL